MELHGKVSTEDLTRKSHVAEQNSCLRDHATELLLDGAKQRFPHRSKQIDYVAGDKVKDAGLAASILVLGPDTCQLMGSENARKLGRIGLVLGFGLGQGIVEEGQKQFKHSPQELRHRAATNFISGGIFGAIAESHPVGLAAVVVGAIGALGWKEFGPPSAERNRKLRQHIKNAAETTDILSLGKAAIKVKELMARDAFDLTFGTLTTAGAYRPGRALTSELKLTVDLKGTAASLANSCGQLLKPGLSLPGQPRLAAAYAGAGKTGDRIANVESNKTTIIDNPNILLREVDFGGRTVKVLDQPAATNMNSGSMVEAPNRDRLNLTYKLTNNIEEMLRSIRVNTYCPLLEEFLKSDSLKSVAEYLSPGKWRPVSTTNRSIEIRNDVGRVVNIGHYDGRQLSPYLIQPISTTKVGRFQLEELPNYEWLDPRFDFDTLQIRAVAPFFKQMDRVGWHTSVQSPSNLGILSTGWKVSLNPWAMNWSSAADSMSEVDHSQAIRVYSAAIQNLGPIYGLNHPVLSGFKAESAKHYIAIGNLERAEGLFHVVRKYGAPADAADIAGRLGFAYRDMSNRGLNESMLNRALYFFNWSNSLTAKAHKMEGY